jgi:2',3'-cyclic-nucleotide 2'-phosphodiesterase (5'-nucleotidase family)
VARRATVIRQIRETDPHVLVLDAGDSLVGDQEAAKESGGGTSITTMNMMGYDAMVLGPKDVALGVNLLRQRISEARFAVLSGNAFEVSTGELVAAPYVLRRWDDRVIAIVGVSGEPGTQEIAVRDPIETAQNIVAEVAPQVDVVILLSHAGPAVDLEIAEVVADIDLIVSGGTVDRSSLPPDSGSQGPWIAQQTGTLVVHADEASPGHAGRNVGMAWLVFDGEGRVSAHEWRRLSLGPQIPDDPVMAEWLTALFAP